MSVKFPLVDIRRNPDGSWNQRHELSELITVPTSAPFIVRLKEIPDDGTINNRPIISGGLIETNIYPPEDGKYYINYKTGDIVFNNNQAGNNYFIEYWQLGSLVEASDINYLYERSLEINSLPPLNPLYGKHWYNIDDGITYVYDIRNKWISLNRMYICFGKDRITKDQYINFYSGRTPSNNSGILLNRKSIILSLSGMFNSIGNGNFILRKNDTNIDIVSLNLINQLTNKNNLINVDLNEDDYLQCYFESLLGADTPMLMIELGWRI